MKKKHVTVQELAKIMFTQKAAGAAGHSNRRRWK